MTFYVVQPGGDGGLARLRQLQARLNAGELLRLVERAQPQPVILLLPRMRLRTSLRLDDELKYLGLKSLFTSAEADLSLLSSGEWIK